MYNKELKMRFIKSRLNEATLPNNYLERNFKKVASAEEKLEKDVCNFTFYEIIEYYKSLHMTSVNGLRVLNSQFSIYTDWCLKQNLVKDGQNHFLELRLDDYHNCVNKAIIDLTILSREEILDITYELPNPKDQFTLLALFEGIKGKDFSEITLLKPEHISGNMITLPSGNKFNISDDLVDIIDVTVKEDTYYSMSGNMKKEIPLIDNGYIIKEYPNVEFNPDNVYQMGRRLYSGIKRMFAFLGKEYLKANDIYNSGLIHMIKEKAKEHKMSCKDYIYSEFFSREIEEKYGIMENKKTFFKKYEDYL